MDTKDLECFEAVYEEKSIHRAASRLFITSQGLGRIIRSLELELDTVLFERTRQGVVPTESGRLLHERCAALLRELHSLQKDLFRIKKKENPFRIGLANGVLRVLPLPRLLAFRASHPEWDLTWTEANNDDITRGVLNGTLEYGLVVGEPREASLRAKRVFSIPKILLVYPEHPLAGESQITLEQLKDEPLITMTDQFRMYHDLIRACRIKGFSPNIIAQTTDGGTLMQLCTQQAGIAVMPDFGIGIPDHLVRIPFAEPTAWEIYAICLQTPAKADMIREFEDHLREES